MATDAQINANRANAQHSTGPRTEEGKARSSRNAVIHGLTGQSPQLPGEPPQQFETILEDYREHLHPAGVLEETLVYRMAVAVQRMTRGKRIEEGLFDLSIRLLSVPAEANEDGKADQIAWAWSVDAKEKSIDRIGRYAKSSQREFDNCHDRLKKIQKERGEAKQEAVAGSGESNSRPLSAAPCPPCAEQATPAREANDTDPNPSHTCPKDPPEGN